MDSRNPIKPHTRIIGIDPSLRGTGFAIVEGDSNKARCLAAGTIRVSSHLHYSECLLQIHSKLSEIMVSYTPAILAIENTIFVQSHQTAILLGAARGTAILCAAQRGLEIHEFAPRRIKQAVVGRGAATKQQVAFMVRALCGLQATPSADEADAIAVALTYLQEKKLAFRAN